MKSRLGARLVTSLSMSTRTTSQSVGTSLVAASDESLMASRLGLDPTINRFHAPIVYHEGYSCPDWPESHTFPMDKFRRLQEAVLTPSSSLPRPLVRSSMDFFRPLDASNIPLEDWIMEPHGPMEADFVERFVSGNLSSEEERWIGFREQTSRPELIERTLLEVGGTILACQLACQYGLASNLAGGTHHAHPQGGAGYTILNDLAIATHFMTDPQRSNGIDKVLVIDCYVHQGDGTAKFHHLHEEGRLYTLSLHCASNYPHPKAHSSMDVGLSDGMHDEEYLQILQTSVDAALEEFQPDLVLYDAGVDVYEKDTLGRLKLTENGGLRRRDRWVLERCLQADIPIAAVIGGGYDKDRAALARRHAIVHEECAYVWRKYKLWKGRAKQRSNTTRVY